MEGEPVRLTVRYRLPDGSATDVIGILDAHDERQVVLTDRHGRTHRIDRAAIIAARRVPAVSSGPDPLRVPPSELERAAADGWHDVVRPLGGWRLRAGPITNRANSCLAVGDPGLPADRAGTEIVAFAAEHGRPPRAQVIVGSSEEHALLAAGWRPTADGQTVVMVSRLTALCALGGPEPAALATTPTPGWRQVFRGEHVGEVSDADLDRLLGSGTSTLALLGDPDRPAAIGRGAVATSWLTLSSLWTDPARRRVGLMRRIVAALGWWAAERDARSVQLHVHQANGGALAAYRRLGLTEHHRYRYLMPG